MAEIIRIESLKRDPDRIKSYLKIIKTSTVTTQPLPTIFPTRYEEIGLAKIDMVCDVFNVAAILDNEDNFIMREACYRIAWKLRIVDDLKKEN